VNQQCVRFLSGSRDAECALREGRLTYEESGALLKFYEEGLHGYTYPEDVHGE
jgi:arginine decarboxylase